MAGTERPECTVTCRSSVHARIAIAAVTQSATDEQVVSYLQNLCSNYANLTDGHGRSVLHAAAACNRWRIIEWLLKGELVEVVSGRDHESGWTPLHRAFFYGQLSAAKVLLDHGASVSILDDDSLTPFDIVMKDRPPYIHHSDCGLSDVYVWGINDNYNLGSSFVQSLETPELLSFFRKENVNVQQVVVCKFHTVFVSTGGHVFSCGHGQGGRLGHRTQMTAIVPQRVDLSHEVCGEAAAGTDHTIFLMQSGTVWTCGLNKHHQLGHDPPPKQCLTPKMIDRSVFKSHSIIGVCAANFHSVAFSENAVFTFGLNAGQLGHLEKDNSLQSVPKLVSALTVPNICFRHVVASDGATVCATESGDIYTLHEYRCRKIASKLVTRKQGKVKQLEAMGGNLDLKRDAETRKTTVITELRVAVLMTCGRLFVWSESRPHLTRCLMSLDRHLTVMSFALFRDEIVFTTDDGEGFVGAFQPPKIQDRLSEIGHGRPQKHSRWLEPDECFCIDVKRLPNVHRAVKVACDPRGSNFAVIQRRPEVEMSDFLTASPSEMSRDLKEFLAETDRYDDIHDVVLNVGHQQFVAHRFILAAYSGKFRQHFIECAYGLPRTEWAVVDYSNIHPEIFDQVLKFLYTGTCDLLTDGQEFPVMQFNQEVLHSSSVVRSALTNEQPDLVVCTLGGKRNSGGKSPQSASVKTKRDSEGGAAADPISLLRHAAAQLEIPLLTKMLLCVEFVNGKVEVILSFPRIGFKFDRMKYPELSDISIIARNGQELKCHKCILVARSEYFRGMLASRWIQSFQASVNMPFSMDVLEIILDFLYTDDSNVLHSSKSAELIIKVLIAADNLLLDRLRELCEFLLSSLLTLRNVCDLLEMSYVYNSEKLKSSCMKFICLNLPALLESNGGILSLSDDVWEDLTKAYKQLIPRMSYRMITPSSDFPATETFSEVETLVPLDCLEVTITSNEDDAVKSGHSKRKRQKRRSTNSFSEDSREERRREDSTCSMEATLDRAIASANAISSPIDVPNRDSNLLDTPVSTQSLFKASTSTPKQKWFGGDQYVDDAFPDLLDELQRQPHVKTDNSSPRSSKSTRRRWVSLDLATCASAPPPPAAQSVPVEKVVRLAAWGRQDDRESPKSLKEIMTAEKAVVKCNSVPLRATRLPLPVVPRNSGGSRRAWSTSESSTNLGDRDSDAVLCFNDILRLEKEQQNAVKRIHTKRLAFIQMEDKAMDELMEFYRRQTDNEENIIVERMFSNLVATPIWKPSK